MPKFSIATWAFMYGQYKDAPWPIEKILEWTARAGYDGTEFCGFHMPSPEDEYDTNEKCAALMRLVRDCGLEAASYAAQCRAAPPSVSPREDYMARFEKALAFCSRCSIPVMRLDSAIKPEALSREEYERRFDRLVGNWRASARRAAQEGVTLVFESEPTMWLNKPSEVLAAVEAVDEPNFRILFDLSHGYVSAVRGMLQTGERETLPGGVIEYINMLGNHIGAVHTTDTNGRLYGEDSGGAGTSVHLPLGEGILDLDAIIAALWPYAGELEYWSLDFFACRDAETTGIESLRLLKKKIAEYQEKSEITE